MVPAVDPNDDSVWRWVVQHYRFDPERNQRRRVVVAAYDNEAEFDAALTAYIRLISAGIDGGDRDPREHVGGVIWHPGYHAEQARGRQADHDVTTVHAKGFLGSGAVRPIRRERGPTASWSRPAATGSTLDAHQR